MVWIIISLAVLALALVAFAVNIYGHYHLRNLEEFVCEGLRHTKGRNYYRYMAEGQNELLGEPPIDFTAKSVASEKRCSELREIIPSLFRRRKVCRKCGLVTFGGDVTCANCHVDLSAFWPTKLQPSLPQRILEGCLMIPSALTAILLITWAEYMDRRDVAKRQAQASQETDFAASDCDPLGK